MADDKTFVVATAAAAAATSDVPTAAGPETGEPDAKRARHNPAAKRKVAMLIAYNGAAYQGLQRNPGATTIEDAMEKALHAAGAISEMNVGTLQKISWSRAGRTDKGVHAVGQIISCKLVLVAAGDGLQAEGGASEQAELAATLAAVNAELEKAAAEIRVLGLERATNAFCAQQAREPGSRQPRR